MLPDPAIEPTIAVERGAAILGISRSTLYLMCATGRCPTVPGLGARVRIPTEAFLATFALAGAS